MENQEGKTKDVGFQFGIRKTKRHLQSIKRDLNFEQRNEMKDYWIKIIEKITNKIE